MKRRVTALFALALATPAVGRAQVLPPLPLPLPPLPPPITVPLVPTLCGAVTSPQFAFMRVNNVCHDLSSLIRLDAPTGLFRMTLLNTIVGEGRINSLDVTFRRNPFISFNSSTSNLTAGPTSYTFFFGTPIGPDLYTRATSTGSVSVTSGDAGSATVSQQGGEEFISAFGSQGPSLIPLGVDIGTGTCTAERASTTCNYPPPSGGPQVNDFAPTFFDNLEVTLAYTQTGANSEVAWSGRVDLMSASDVAVIPEPGTVALVSTGLLGLLGVARRRRRRTAPGT